MSQLGCRQLEGQSRNECVESEKDEAGRTSVQIVVVMVCVQVQAQSMAVHEVARIGTKC